MIYIHGVSAQKYVDFLKQNRLDPVTGELIQAGDDVVFCATCSSVFLIDSWSYLGQTHCGQENTLDRFPIPPTTK